MPRIAFHPRRSAEAFASKPEKAVGAATALQGACGAPWETYLPARPKRGGALGASLPAVGQVLNHIHTSKMGGRVAASGNGFGFNFHQHFRINQASHANQTGGGVNLAEKFSVGFGDFLPAIDLGHIDAGAHHVLQT
jgi:hypothetical protein